MNDLLIKNIKSLVSCDNDNTVYQDVDLLIQGGIIKGIEHDIANPSGFDELDASGCIVYPGLVNTHHHFFQAFVRNRVELDWSQLTLMQWLDSIYPIFARMTEDDIYHASIVSLADLIKHGCTTAFDHQYNYTKNAGTHVIDRQFEAAELFGVRFHAGRGTNTLPMSEGSTIPDDMCESTSSFLKDCERLIKTFHDDSAGSMRQVVVAPCQPVNAYPETFSQSAALAREYGVQLHTHLGEGESATLFERHGMRSIEWCEKYQFFGSDTWYAHGWEFKKSEIERLANTNTGISHCPAPVFLVGAEITNLSYMHQCKVRLGLGVDGQASNDNSNLLECVRLAYLLQCLNAQNLDCPIPQAHEYLKIACAGSASLLGRKDIGSLEIGKAGDCFAVNVDGLEYVAATHDPSSLPSKVGVSEPTQFTVIGGKAVWNDGEFPGLDERALVSAATQQAKHLFEPPN